MKKICLYISMLITLLAVSCQQDENMAVMPDLKPGEYRFSVTIPEPTAATRAMGDKPTDVTTMPMHVLVFDENGFFVANQTATVNSFDDAGQTGTYTVSLPPSNEKCILHFVLGNVTYDTYVPDESETSIFSRLTVSNGTDAYWQRIEVDNIKGETQLPMVSLVRNFAKITVDEQLDEIELLGYAIMRNTSEGTVAPYTGGKTANGEFATFAGGTDQKTPYDYTQFINMNNNFGGNTAGEVINEKEAPDAETGFTMSDKYVYERNQNNAERPAYVLLKIRNTLTNKTSYYKLDIVQTDETTYITTYLNLYRNFWYKIHLTKVNGEGYETPEKAMQAVASNNIGASIEVSQVNRIEDGLGNELWVETLDTLLVDTKAVSIRYEYYTDKTDNYEGNLSNESVTVTPVIGSEIGAVNSNAISNWNAKDGVLTVTPAALPALMETQDFILSTPSGLSRRVTVRVREPFRFVAVDCEDVVPRQIGEEVTLIVRLPENMPTAAFPLVLDIEPVERKSIYPDVNQNRIPVESGDQTFSYKATVSFNDYRMASGRFYYHFKTNVATSATSIHVTNPYFYDENNVAKFINEGDNRYDFGRVTLAGADGVEHEDTYQFSEYKNSGKELTLRFDLHKQGDGWAGGEHKVVEIYTDYLIPLSSSTGTYTVDEEKHCLLYIPDDPYARQEIRFKVKQDFATEDIQLSSYDHGTAIISYTTPPCEISVNYTYTERNWGGSETKTDPVPDGATISIYEDSSYQSLIRNFESDNGKITFQTFVGWTENTKLYFQYSSKGMFLTTNYRGEITVEELINQRTITLRSGY